LNLNEIFAKWRFTGTSSRRYTEEPNDEVVLDFQEEGEKSISLSLDAYVSGQYVSRGGRSVEVMFRFNVYVRYSESTMQQAMSAVRAKLIEKFKKEFPGFDATTIFVDPNKWRVPKEPTPAEEVGFYKGTDYWRRLMGTEYARYEIKTRKAIYDTSVSNIKKRYGLK